MLVLTCKAHSSFVCPNPWEGKPKVGCKYKFSKEKINHFRDPYQTTNRTVSMQALSQKESGWVFNNSAGDNTVKKFEHQIKNDKSPDHLNSPQIWKVHQLNLDWEPFPFSSFQAWLGFCPQPITAANRRLVTVKSQPSNQIKQVDSSFFSRESLSPF
jgi:hypothetical protein